MIGNTPPPPPISHTHPYLVLRHGTSHAVYLLLDGLHGLIHSQKLLLVARLLPPQLLQLKSQSFRLLNTAGRTEFKHSIKAKTSLNIIFAGV